MVYFFPERSIQLNLICCVTLLFTGSSAGASACSASEDKSITIIYQNNAVYTTAGALEPFAFNIQGYQNISSARLCFLTRNETIDIGDTWSFNEELGIATYRLNISRKYNNDTMVLIVTNSIGSYHSNSIRLIVRDPDSGPNDSTTASPTIPSMPATSSIPPTESLNTPTLQDSPPTTPADTENSGGIKWYIWGVVVVVVAGMVAALVVTCCCCCQKSQSCKRAKNVMSYDLKEDDPLEKDQNGSSDETKFENGHQQIQLTQRRSSAVVPKLECLPNALPSSQRLRNVSPMVPPGTRKGGNEASDRDSEEALALSRTKVEEFITPQPRHDHDQDQASGLMKEERERYDIGTELAVPVQEQRRSITPNEEMVTGHLNTKITIES